MRKSVISAALFSLIAGFSLAATASQTNPPAPAPATVQAATAVAPVAVVNLNTADAATLQSELVGIGAAKAQAIVAYREEHGNFASVDELLEVKGIGEATLEKNRDRLSVN